MTITTQPSLEVYWKNLSRVLPDFTPEQQRVAVAVYRELAKGKAVSLSQIGEALEEPSIEALDLLNQEPLRRFIYRDENGRVAGFAGIATAPMHHEFNLSGRKLWTWCAWDGLFIPLILGETAEIGSPDPETGELVRLRVSPSGIEMADPESTVVSFLVPGAGDFETSTANVMASFCHFVFFFASRDSSERWAAKHAGTFLYSLDEAWKLAELLTEKQYGRELARGRTSMQR